VDLNAAQLFVSVVRVGSLSATAARMRIPLATLSRRVRELERQLGVQLLERSARGTKLTDAGQRLYEHASRGIDALADAEEAVRSDQARLKGRLRLSLPPSFEPWWHLLGAFQRRYPDIQVAVYTTERAVDLVVEGIDVTLRVGAFIHENLVARRLLHYRHVLVAAPSLLERFGGRPASPEALRSFPCALWRRDVSSPAPWRLGDQVVEPSAVLAVNDYLHLRARALAGDVVTELPPFLAAESIQSGRLVAVLPAFPLPQQQVSLLHPVHRHPSSIVRAYLDFCQQELVQFLDGPNE
jgi:DNA-binding transcriptional LysR family regulator